MTRQFNKLMKKYCWSVAELEEALDLPSWTRLKILHGEPIKDKTRRRIKERVNELLKAST